MYVIWLNETEKLNPYLVGNKASNIGKLRRYGFNVPEGFCITREACEEFLLESNVKKSFFGESISGESEQDITNAILYYSIPSKIEKEIEKAYKILSNKKPRSNYVVIRSSSIDEDSLQASYAGQYKTFLNIGTFSDILYYIKKCWGATLSKKNFVYKVNKNLNIHELSIGVIVQKIIPSEISGVIFTIHPLPIDYDTILIEASWGLGDTIVSGEVEPDRYIVRKKDFTVQHITIGEKKIMSTVNLEREGIRKIETTQELATSLTLTKKEIFELAKIGIKIESYVGSPQDIEWCKGDKCIYVLQTRPIVLQDRLNKLLDSDVWTDEKINERFPDPLMPLDATLLKYWFFEPTLTYLLKSFGIKRIEDNDEICRIFKGKLYLNKKLLSQIFKDISIEKAIFTEKSNNSIKSLKVSKFFLLRLGYLIITTYKRSLKSIYNFNKSIKKIKATDYARLSWDQLSLSMRKIYNIYFAISKHHMVSIVIGEILYFFLENILKQFFMEEEKNGAKILISGVWNKTTEMNQQIYLLIQHIQKNKQVKEIFLAEPICNLLAKLETMKEAQEFIKSFQNFLDRFGHRSEKYEISFPRWNDQPEIILERLKDCITLKSRNSLFVKQETKEKEVKIITDLKRTLRKKSFDKLLPFKLILFSIVLKYARRYGGFLREEEGYYITMILPEIKRFFLTIADKLVKGRKIRNPEDIFFLELFEIEGIINTEILRCENLEKLIKERKRQHELNTEFFKVDQQKDYMQGNVGLRGMPVSSGIYTGQARVIDSYSAYSQKLNEGEILVTKTLNPSWAIVFPNVKAIITEVGGILSHGAILAREYGIPAIVGVKNAMRIIKNGQNITVNGNNGSIYY